MSLPLLTSPRGQLMLGYVTSLYDNSRVMQSVFQADGLEFDALRDAMTRTLNQFYVNTADWGLDQWESELNLPADPSLTDDERRSRIKSKLRGYGTATIQLVKNMAQAYENGTIDVIEDAAAYTVHIRFVDTKGVPANINDLKHILRKVIPSHLDIIYDYKYNLYSDFEGKYTWGQMDASGLTWGDVLTKLPS